MGDCLTPHAVPEGLPVRHWKTTLAERFQAVMSSQLRDLPGELVPRRHVPA